MTRPKTDTCLFDNRIGPYLQMEGCFVVIRGSLYVDMKDMDGRIVGNQIDGLGRNGRPIPLRRRIRLQWRLWKWTATRRAGEIQP